MTVRADTERAAAAQVRDGGKQAVAQQADWERHMRAGFAADQQGNYAEAVKQTKAALSAAEAFGPDDPCLATTLNNLGELYRTQGRYTEVEPLHKRALAIREKALGPDDPSVAQSLNNLAGLYRAQGRYAKAEPLYKRALAIFEKTLGPTHPDVATSLNNLAGLYDAQGRYAEAEPLYKRALAILEKALGPEHPHVALTLTNLGGALHRPGSLRRGRAATQAGARDPGKGAGARSSKRRPEPGELRRGVEENWTDY